ncbi:nose resistant to fluoxetine protein 6-like [Nylanderia fulva]|uniref:nose resistant to fluoxetine protein 6-like n=1 Tax=Nylanderia fulva TaxID=613905 RepID=UPI0010FAD2DA|nr:nose resistant to fluoxetine protein 6-like [Nylanderia fulva]
MEHIFVKMLYYGILLYLLLLHRLVTSSNVSETILKPLPLQDLESVEESIVYENSIMKIWQNFTKQFTQDKDESKLSSINTTSDKNVKNEFWDVDQLLEIWNPITTSRTWKNETYRDAGISLPCNEDLTHYMMGISRKANWALKMMDADGKYTWGTFSGNRRWMGNADQCRKLENEFVEWQQNERLQQSEELPPFRVSVNSINFMLDILKPGLNETYDMTLALCMPIMCNTQDIERLLYFVQNQSSINLPFRITIDHIRNLSKGYSFWEDTTFYILLISFAVVFVLIFMGTSYDILLRYKILRRAIKKNNNNITIMTQSKSLKSDENYDCQITISKLWTMTKHNGSLDVRNPEVVPKPLSEALLSFSLLLNISKVCSLDVGADTLAPIHGLKFYTMLWIILVHTCLLANEISDSKMYRNVAESDFFYQTIGNGTYSVDTFFFLSGCLVAFLYYRTMTNKRIKEKSIIKGCRGQLLQFLAMMWYRYFRLTPIYLLVIGLIQVSMKWYHDHSVIEFPAMDYKTCEKFWWRHALYINTYFDMDDRCMVWSWYLANDTQFYTIGIIILIIGASFLPAAMFIGAFFLITSWITTAIITLNIKYVPSVIDPFEHYENLYDKPWLRMGPYLVGMATGWYLFKIDCKANMNKIVIAIGWFVSCITMFSIVYGLHGTTFGPTLSALYTALSHSGWAMCLAWILIACVTGNGGIANHILSWKYLYPISRLTYCAYLVHPALLRAMILQGESSWHLTHGFVAFMFFGTLVATYAASLFLSLCFEAPVVSLLRIVHPMREWKLNYIK